MNMYVIKLSIGCFRAWGRSWEAWCRLRQHLWGIPCITCSRWFPHFGVSSPHYQALLYLPLLKIAFSKEHPPNATYSLPAEATSSHPRSGHHSHNLLKKRFWEIMKMISTSTMVQGGLYKRPCIILVSFLLERWFLKIALANAPCSLFIQKLFLSFLEVGTILYRKAVQHLGWFSFRKTIFGRGKWRKAWQGREEAQGYVSSLGWWRTKSCGPSQAGIRP